MIIFKKYKSYTKIKNKRKKNKKIVEEIILIKLYEISATTFSFKTIKLSFIYNKIKNFVLKKE